MVNKEITCICCPVGCSLEITKESDGALKVTGNTCQRGVDYGIKEITNPTRTITTTVKVIGTENRMLPVKSKSEISKDNIMECMKALATIEVNTPIEIGDVILENAGNTGIDMIATKSIT